MLLLYTKRIIWIILLLLCLFVFIYAFSNCIFFFSNLGNKLYYPSIQNTSSYFIVFFNGSFSCAFGWLSILYSNPFNETSQNFVIIWFLIFFLFYLIMTCSIACCLFLQKGYIINCLMAFICFFLMPFGLVIGTILLFLIIAMLLLNKQFTTSISKIKEGFENKNIAASSGK